MHITSRPLREMNANQANIKVTICCVTYNHVAFIREALEGFLLQETDFPVELLVHDDASTDGTAEIVEEYAARYPHLVNATLQATNQYSQGVNILADIRYRAKGDYLAYCEGDDYWVDPHKLQLQANYLDQYSETMMVGHNTIRINQQGDIITEPRLRSWRMPFSYPHSLTARQIKALKYMVPSCCKMFRNKPLPTPKNAENTPYGDAINQSMLGGYGGYHYLASLQPSIYRVHDGGLWSGDSSIVRQQKMMSLYVILLQYYLGRRDWLTSIIFVKKYMIANLKFMFLKVKKLEACI
jgi:glycosyltransferase involved in cell wall biosynthesis